MKVLAKQKGEPDLKIVNVNNWIDGLAELGKVITCMFHASPLDIHMVAFVLPYGRIESQFTTADFQ